MRSSPTTIFSNPELTFDFVRECNCVTAPTPWLPTVPSCSPQLVKSMIFRLMLPVASKIGTAAFRWRIVKMIPNADVQRLREISDVMHQRSVLIYNEKKAALEKGDEALKHQIGEGRDIMSILCEYISWMHTSMYLCGCPGRRCRAGRAGSSSARC